MEPSRQQPEHADLLLAKPNLPTDGPPAPSAVEEASDSTLPPQPPTPSGAEGNAVPASSQQAEPAPSSAPATLPASETQEVLPESLSTESSAVQSVLSQLDNLTIFGNKSLDELHQIQARRSHLSAGILFSDPSLRM